MDWEQINNHIFSFKSIRDPGERQRAFEKLYQETKYDGFVALALGEHHEVEGDNEAAQHYYWAALQRLPSPRGEWRRWALHCWERVTEKLNPVETGPEPPKMENLPEPSLSDFGLGGQDSPATPACHTHLRSWSIRNFRSIGETKLELGRLTLFTGPNSSGKSSFLHSLLLAAQSTRPYDARAPQFPASVITTGELINLGAPSRFLRLGADNDFRLGLAVGSVEAAFCYRNHSAKRGEELRLISFSIVDSSAPAVTDQMLTEADMVTRWKLVDASLMRALQPEIVAALKKACSLEAGPPSEATVSCVDIEEQCGTPMADSCTARGPESSTMADHPLGLCIESSSVRHLLDRVVVVSPYSETSLYSAVAGYADPSWIKSADVCQQGTITLMVRRCVTFVQLAYDLCEKSPGGIYVSPVVVELARTHAMTRRRAAEEACRVLVEQHTGIKLGPEVPESFRKRVLEILHSKEPIYTDIPVRSSMSGPMASALSLLHNVCYLGPLRISPSPDANYFANAGTRGEQIATKLFYLGDRRCRYVRRDGSTAEDTLLESVSYWLRELEVADSVTTEQPYHRYEAFIATLPDSYPVDIASVGVGVSQVLPILVEGLAGDNGSVFVVEQPELHLHPSIQARLADFLISLMRRGRQVIVETHSEHLVDRLRLRVAEEEVSARDIKIYYARLSGDSSEYRSLDMDSFGDLAEWPPGFFDEGGRHAERILEVTAHRIRRDRQQQ